VTLAREIRDNSFNSIRLPWSNAMFEEDPGSCAASPTPFEQPCVSPGLLIANPGLAGMDAIGVYRAVVQALGHEGVMVVLDNHTTDAQWAPGTTNGIWWGGVLWDDLVAAQLAQCPLPGDAYCWKKRIHLWQRDWLGMVTLFQSEPNFVAVDLRNEPNDRFSYSGGPEGWCDLQTCASDGPVPAQPMQWSWGPTAAWAGDAILGEDANLLVIVEGTDFSNDLTGVFHHWLSLVVPGRLVYSPHAYSNDTFDTGTEYGSMSPGDLFKTMGDNWGYIITQGKPFTAPVWVGEFGVCNTSDACTTAPRPQGDGTFRANFTTYLSTGDIDWSYWPLDGTHSDGGPAHLDFTWFKEETFGILNTTWSAPKPTALLSLLPFGCTQGPGC
jgi:endoglucanase